MICNVSNFKRLIQKATVNFSIESLQLNLDKDRVKTSMASPGSLVISILNVENDILTDVKGELQFNFNDPANEIVPYLNLIDGENETVLKVSEEKVSLLTGKQMSHIFFCSPQIVSVLNRTEPKGNFPVFHSFSIDQEFEKVFDKIKKIGARFNKIYFGVDKGTFYIETADKTNRFSNSFRNDLGEVKYTDVSLCFEYKNVVNLMSIIGGEEFKVDFYYLPESLLGMLKATNDDGECYYLMSQKEQ
jgi:hypothetical protein